MYPNPGTQHYSSPSSFYKETFPSFSKYIQIWGNIQGDIIKRMRSLEHLENLIPELSETTEVSKLS